jgi:hypothetical protein
MSQKCKPFVERLCDALGEDLNSPICRELKEHLENCPDCALQIDTVKRTVEIYRSIPGQRVPSEMQKRLLARLNLPAADKSPEAM